MQKPKILFVGGGSGGHITPNLALIEYLVSHHAVERDDVLYIGTRKGMEHSIVTSHGIAFQSIVAGKLRRYFDLRNCIDIFKFLWGIIQAFCIIGKCKPDIVFSKGGYVSVPVAIAAWMRHIPVVTHESDIISGLANRIIKRFAQKICLTFPKEQYEKKEVLTGLPVQSQLLKGVGEEGYRMTGFSSGKPVLLVMGGSLGAYAINEFVWDNMEELLKIAQIIHIVGKGNMNIHKQADDYIQYEFVDRELPHLYAIADLIVSRAGATTIAEFARLGKASLLIPLPTYASRGEQKMNATFLQNKQAAVVLDQEQLQEIGARKIRELIMDEEKRKELSKNIVQTFPEDACERIWRVMSAVFGKEGKKV